MARTDQMVDTKLGRLHVEIDGDGDPAVLWHSLFVDSSTWSALRPMLRDDRQLLMIDGPGHGQSGQCGAPPVDFTLDDCAGAAGEVLDALGVRQAVDWVGNAWGGHVGLTLARALLGEAFIRSRPEDTARVMQSFRDAPRVGMHRAMRNVMLKRQDLDSLLPRVTTPALMAVPTADAVVPVEQIHRAVAQMPAGKSVEIDGEGHVAPLIAQAEELAAAIREFWRDASGYIAR